DCSPDERSHELGCSNFAQVGTSTSTAFMDTGLFASKSYTYRVQASGPGGLSAYSNAASATTQAPPPPTAPSNLTAAAASSSQINLSWTASSGAVTSYRSDERRVGEGSDCRRPAYPASGARRQTGPS